jgi:hypothetical protein
MSSLRGVFRSGLVVPLRATVVGCVLTLFAYAAMARQPPVPYGPADVAAFLGTWCAQGDPSKQTSIAAGNTNGPFLTLTNEAGSTSYGHLQAPGRIVAPEWQFVVGRLSPDGSQINWSNGTMWSRCPDNGGGWPGDFPRLAGIWFAGGDRSRRCSIRQRQGSLFMQNEAGQTASGSFVRRHLITTSWNGAVIQGRISRDGNRIDWDNGTYWVRDAVYSY